MSRQFLQWLNVLIRFGPSSQSQLRIQFKVIKLRMVTGLDADLIHMTQNGLLPRDLGSYQ